MVAELRATSDRTNDLLRRLQIQELEKRVAAAENQARVASEQAASEKRRADLAVSEQASAADKLASLEITLRSSLVNGRRASAELAHRTDEVTQLRVQLDQAYNSSTDQELAAVREAEREKEEYFAEWQAAEDRNLELRCRAEDLEGQIKDLNQQNESARLHAEDLSGRLAELDNQRHEARTVRATAVNARRMGLNGFLEALLPRTELDPDAVEALQSFPNPADAVRVLIGLDKNDRSVTPKKVRGFVDIWEVDGIATGDPNSASMGRAYYKCITDNRLEVMLEHKPDNKHQSHTIARFAQRSSS